jgi:hypothetical protein
MDDVSIRSKRLEVSTRVTLEGSSRCFLVTIPLIFPVSLILLYTAGTTTVSCSPVFWYPYHPPTDRFNCPHPPPLLTPSINAPHPSFPPSPISCPPISHALIRGTCRTMSPSKNVRSEKPPNSRPLPSRLGKRDLFRVVGSRSTSLVA